MTYGYYISDTVGNKRFFIEGCTCCRMSTGGQHESNCPYKDIKIDEEIKIREIEDRFSLKVREL